MTENNKSPEKKVKINDSLKVIKIFEKKEVFCGTADEVAIIDGEYCLFVLGNEKFETTTYLREYVYGKKATTGRIQRIYKSS